MSLVITYNKKDISIHQCLWALQGFDFMTFSDKFQTVNLQEILNLSGVDKYDPTCDPENETNEENIDMDKINTISDSDNKIKEFAIDMSKLKKDN